MRFKFIINIVFLLLFLSVNAQESKVKKFKQLSCPEKRWVMCHPFVAKKALMISEKTRKITAAVQQDKLLNGKGNGDQVDAFRHAFWMAHLTQTIGWRKAKRLGKAHEKGNYKEYKKRKLEDGVLPDKVSSEMDLFNNEVGIHIGKMSNGTELKNIVIEAVKEGRCKIVKQDQNGYFLDVEGKIIPHETLKGTWENDKCLVNSNVSQ